jgi:NADPH-dependent 2,4-dienoyl-CoA reductase/sulfur reductase-like enzyme
MTLHVPSIAVVIDRLFNIPVQNKPEVVVIGAGWGSNAFVNTIDRSKYKVKVISTSPNRLNQPRLIPDFTPSYKVSPVQPTIDKCISVRPESKTVLGMNSVYTYDYLVLATGSEPNDFGIKGVKNHCLMFKTEDDLQKLQNHLGNTPKRVSIIGAGPTGIELAFKLQSFGHTVTIIEASNTILPGFSDKMRSSATYLLNKRSIQVNLNTKIVEVSETAIHTPDGSTRRDPILIWTAGVKPTEFIRELTPEGRQLKTDDNLMFSPHIYALGDIVANRGPPTAQNAKQQGLYLANHFNNRFISPLPYKYIEKGRALDTTDGLIIEYQGSMINLPPLLRSVFYCFVD